MSKDGHFENINPPKKCLHLKGLKMSKYTVNMKKIKTACFYKILFLFQLVKLLSDKANMRKMTQNLLTLKMLPLVYNLFIALIVIGQRAMMFMVN